MNAIQVLKLSAAVATIGLGACALMPASPPEQPHVAPVRDYVVRNVKPWLSEPIVVDTVKSQNTETAKLKDIDINRLDIGWMERSNRALIDSKMNNPLSTFLRDKKAASNAVIFEIFIFDYRGLNVGQTDLTQDYNQGDEAKYWRTYQEGPDAVFVDKVGKDGGRNVSQASLTIKDPATGQAIGAVTVGIDVDRLK